jgi:hypothetical protein
MGDDRAVDTQPNLGDATLAVASVTVGLARIPLRAAERLPGMARLSAEGAGVRMRARSRLEGLLDEILRAPEVERAIDRILAGGLPDAIARSLLERRVVERIAAEVTVEVDVETAVAGALDSEFTQRTVEAVLASPGFDRLLAQATERALNGPEMQMVMRHVADSPEIRDVLTTQSTTLAGEMAEGVRTRAEAIDDAAERTVRGWLRRPRTA